LLDALLCWALKECPIWAEIYENTTFPRFRWLRVEIIEDFFYEKVIHRSFFFNAFIQCTPCTAAGIPPFRWGSGCPDKYLKTY
jgi:hypothetical protein